MSVTPPDCGLVGIWRVSADTSGARQEAAVLQAPIVSRDIDEAQESTNIKEMRMVILISFGGERGYSMSKFLC